MEDDKREDDLVRAVALENARAILAARQRAEEELLAVQAALREETRGLEILNSIGLRLGSNLDSQTILQSVTDAATELSGAKFGAFFYNFVGKDGAGYQLFTLSGAPRGAFEEFDMPRATPVFQPTFHGEGIVRSEDITKDPRYGKMSPHYGTPKGHLPVTSYLAVPVVARSGKVLGGLFLGHPERGIFTERSERLVAGLAAQASVAIDNARLYESERQARTQAEHMSELKDEFLTALSHELRTPLSAILGWVQVMEARQLSPEDLRKALQVIERNARAQTRLIEDLLDMSRITSGRIRLDVQSLTPAAILEATIETVRPAAEAKGIRIEKLLDPQAGPIWGDPGRIQQVLWNLLSNAIKFTPKSGKVQIVLQRVSSHIEMSIADTGIGITPEFLPHVFDRFRQADGSTTRRHGGLGLGLAIAKHLVELHGGVMRAASLGENRGATFTVQLPLTVMQPSHAEETRAHPTTHAADSAPPSLPDLAGLRVLVVDDHSDTRDLIRRVLQDCGARVVTAGSAEEALAAVKVESPDVIVSDIGMPDSDGLDLLRRLRALEGNHRGGIPVIALTAFARAEDRMKVLRAGFRMHLSKPVEPAELCVAVANAAGRVE